MRGYSLKTRSGGKVVRERFDELAAALAAVEDRGETLQGEANARPIDLKVARKFEPVQLVFARLELSGPQRLRAGVDIRGDGSAEAWTGKLRRSLVEQAPGQSAYEALKQELED